MLSKLAKSGCQKNKFSTVPVRLAKETSSNGSVGGGGGGAPSHFPSLLQMQTILMSSFFLYLRGMTLPGGSSLEEERLLR